MKSMGRTHAVIRAAALGALGLSLGSSALLAQEGRRTPDRDDDRRSSTRAGEVDTTFAIAANASLDVQMPHIGRGSADVTVRGWARSEMRVQGETSEGQLSLSIGARHVDIGTRGQSGRTNVERLEIHVPYGTRVHVNSGNGDIAVAGTRGPVDLTSFNGDIVVSEAADRIEITTFNGDINASGIDGRLSVNASNGDVEIDDARGEVEVNTLNGDIGLDRIQSSSVRAKTMSGRITYDGSVERTGEYSFNAFSGSIEMAIPANVGATLSVSTFSGTLDSPDFPLTLSPGTRSRESRGQSMTFDLGGGGARISLESFSGEITIRQRGADRRGN
jgi:hypothetical protein